MSRILAAVAALALLPLAASAQEAPASTVHRHLGFALRLELGMARPAMKAESGGASLELSGVGGGFALALGGAVSEDFILGFQVWDGLASDPKVTVSGGGVSESGTGSGSSGLVGYGMLLNWYLQPSNLYVSVTPSLTRLVMDPEEGETGVSAWGFGARAALGTEWWVSDHWGLGVAGWYGFSRNDDSDAEGAPTWTTHAVGVNFSATYN